MRRVPLPSVADCRDYLAQHENTPDNLVLGGLPDDDR